MTYTCPVCGFDDLTDDPNSISSFEICPCCFFQFRVSDNDAGFTYEAWRKGWIESGTVWNGKESHKPKGWNPKKQLLNIGVKLP